MAFPIECLLWSKYIVQKIDNINVVLFELLIKYGEKYELEIYSNFVQCEQYIFEVYSNNFLIQ